MNVGVFFGSRNPEHEISIITGLLIISTLKKLGHNAVPVYLDKKGRWYIDQELGSLKFFKNLKESRFAGFKKMQLDMDASSGKLVFRSAGLFAKEFQIDLAFPALHGANGEDGTIQGLFELLNVPYVGCDVASSAITMDKVLTKFVYAANKIPTTDFVYFTASEWAHDKANILKRIKTELRAPYFVKPPRLGSSIGINKAKTDQELELGIEVALHYDAKVLVENGVEEVMDITVAVLGNDDPKPSLIQEAVFSDQLFSYEDKYLKDGGAQLGNAKTSIVIPARLDPQVTQEIRDMAVKIFKLMGCSGTSRIDFLFDKQANKFYANEVNTMPGTLYHHLWKASGMEVELVVKKLIELALEKFESKKKITETFESELLNYAQSIKLQLKE